MSKFDLKPEVKRLRLLGNSIGSIADRLNLSKSTVSIWCSEFVLPDGVLLKLKQKMIDAGAKGRLAGAFANKQKKIETIKTAKIWAERKLNNNTQILPAIIALYWAEGAKTISSGSFNFINSDPSMILFMRNWLINDLKVSSERIMPRLIINISHKSRIKKVLKFWSNLLELPEDAFGNVTYIKTVSKKIYENHDRYYGVVRLRVANGTELKYRMLALIEEFKKRQFVMLA